jgi:hypothetical protein
MTERTAIRILWAFTLLAAAVLVVAVRVFDAGDEALVLGTMSIVIVSSLAAGQVTVHFPPPRRRDDE